MKKSSLIILIAAIVVLAAIAGVVWYRHSASPQSYLDSDDGHDTQGSIYFEEDIPSADPLLVGRWQNADNPQWYKVYYDDYAEDGFFWGKEWDESDDVLEEDLNYHGNGWFRWTKQGDEIQEISTMDLSDVPIAKTFRLKKSDRQSLTFIEKSTNRSYRFSRQSEK